MNDFSKNQSKLKLYAKIQEHICTLRQDSTDEDIDRFFKEEIPSSFFDEKDNLIMICQLFAMFGRYDRYVGRVVVKLFERIMSYIKRDLQNSSSIIWEIFGSCYYFKYWMYKEGLIDIDQIIQSALSDEYSIVAQYFLPEIIEYNEDLFYREIKEKFSYFSSNKNSYSKEEIENLKVLREKHWIWLKESNNFNDEMYKEIEKNPIRLAIKKDDALTFQSLLSKSNLSVNETVTESIVEHFLRVPIEMYYIEYAAQYNAINVFNFLLLNDVKINPRIVSFIVHWDNYDMIHAVESRLHTSFVVNGLLFAVESWNSEFVDYIIDKYEHKYLIINEEEEDEEEKNDETINENFANQNSKKEEIKDDLKDEKSSNTNDSKKEESKNDSKDEKSINKEDKSDKKRRKKDIDIYFLIQLFDVTIHCYNMMFLKSYFIPFLTRNNHIFPLILNDFMKFSFQDMSVFSSKLLMSFNGININSIMKKNIKDLLIYAFHSNNIIAVEKLLNDFYDANINISEISFYACANLVNNNIVKLISQHKDFDINYLNPEDKFTVIHIALAKGNFIALRYFFKTFQNIVATDFEYEIFFVINENHFMALKCLFEYLIQKYDDNEFNEIIDRYKNYYKINEIDESINLTIDQLIKDIKSQK